MKHLVIALLLSFLFVAHSHAEPEFKAVSLDAEKLATFIGVTYCGFQFTPQAGKTKVGCAIKEYAVKEGKLAEGSTIASIDCEVDISKDPKYNVFSLMCRKLNGSYRVTLRLINNVVGMGLDRDIFADCNIKYKIPLCIEGLNVLAIKQNIGSPWSSSKPLEGVDKIVTIEFSYK